MRLLTATEIKPITADQAKTFYWQIPKRDRQSVSISDSGEFYGFFDKSTGIMLGMVSALKMPNSIRIKSLLVRRTMRGLGIGSSLLGHLVYDGVRYTAYATPYSRNLFSLFGFVEKSRNSKDICYMVKES